MTTFNLLCCASLNDATSLYRCAGAFSALRRTIPGFNPIFATGEAWWSTIAAVDAIYMQRPHTPAHVQLMQKAKSMGRPVWADYDDHLLEIPIDNPAHDGYAVPEIQRSIRQGAQIADLISVSTRELVHVFVDVVQGSDVEISRIPNAVDTELFGALALEPSDRQLVLWRGTKTHERDLMEYGHEIIEVANAQPAWEWRFMGYTPWFLLKHLPMNRVKLTKSKDPIDYFSFIRYARPALVIVPLADHRFNHCKSNIAWLEATMVGAACLAPAWEEWAHPGVITYESPDDFRVKLAAALNGEIDLAAKWRASADYVRQRLQLHEVNKQRELMVNRLKYLSRDVKWREHAISRRWVAKVEVADAGS